MDRNWPKQDRRPGKRLACQTANHPLARGAEFQLHSAGTPKVAEHRANQRESHDRTSEVRRKVDQLLAPEPRDRGSPKARMSPMRVHLASIVRSAALRKG